MKKMILSAGVAALGALPSAAFAAYTEPTNHIVVEAAIFGAVIFGVLGAVMLRTPGAVIGVIVGAAAGAVMAIL